MKSRAGKTRNLKHTHALMYTHIHMHDPSIPHWILTGRIFNALATTQSLLSIKGREWGGGGREMGREREKIILY